MLTVGIIVHVQTCLSGTKLAQSILPIAPGDMSSHDIENRGEHSVWSFFIEVSGDFPTCFAEGVHQALFCKLRLRRLYKSNDITVSF
jgi:hypothetical protein